MLHKFTVKKIEQNGDLGCVDENGKYETIDARTDRAIFDKETYEWKVGDVFECEIYPYIPCYFARYPTIKKLTTKQEEN